MMRKTVSPQYRKKVLMEATILEVVSPCHFIVRETPNASMSNEAHQFLAMEERLNKYYRSREVVYCSMPEKDEVVVILPEREDKWYRARVIYVLETMKGPSVNCYLLDYGGRCMVSRDRMYKIAEEFLSVPFQAVDFILLGIKPMTMTIDCMLNISYGPAEDWDCASKDYVKTLCAEMEAAFMEIHGFDSDGCFYGNLHIDDGKCKFCLNEELVTKKYAILNMDSCKDIQKFDSPEISYDAELVEKPVQRSDVSVSEEHVLQSHLDFFFDHGTELTKEDLKSLRKSLESKSDDDKAENSGNTSESSSRAKPKAYVSKQYMKMKGSLIKSRPCSENQQKSISQDESSADNAIVSKTCPQLSSSMQSKVRSLYKKKLKTSQAITTVYPNLSTSSLLPEEKFDKLSPSDTSFSSCSVPFFSTDDESTSRQPSTPFPEEEARSQLRQKSSHTNYRVTSVASQKEINCQMINSILFTQKRLHTKSSPVSVDNSNKSVDSLGNADPYRYPTNVTSYCKSETPSGLFSPNNYSQTLNSTSVSSTDSTCAITHVTPKYSYNESHHSNLSPPKAGENCTVSSPNSPSSVKCASSVASTRHSPKDADPRSLQKKLLRLSKSRVSPSASLGNASPPTPVTNSQQPNSSSNSLKNCTNSFSHNTENASQDQTSMSLPSNTMPPRCSSRGTDFGLLRKKFLRLQKGKVSSNTSICKRSSPPVDVSSRSDSGCSSSEKCDNSVSYLHYQNLSPDGAAVSLSGTVSCSESSPSSNSTEIVQSLQPLNKAVKSDIKSSDSESAKEQSSEKKIRNLSDQITLQTRGEILASVAQKNVSPLPHIETSHHYNEQLSSDRLSCVAQKMLPVGKLDFTDGKENPSSTQKNELSKKNSFSGAQKEVLSSEHKLPLPITNEHSQSTKMSSKDNLDYSQNQPLSWQSDGKRVSVDELFVCCKELGETTSSVNAASSYVPSSNKILNHVRKAFKKGVLHPVNQNTPLKSSHVSAVLGAAELQMTNSQIVTSDSLRELPQPGSKKIELDDTQDCDVSSPLSSRTNQNIDSAERNMSDSCPVTVADVPLQQQNGHTIQNLPDQKLDSENGPTIDLNKTQELEGGYEIRASDDPRIETSSNARNEVKSVSEFHLNRDECQLKDDSASGISEDSSDEENNPIYRSTTYSVVQSLTQQIVNSSNSLCGQYFKTELDFSDKSLWDMASIPAVSIGDCVPPPLKRTEEVPFTDQIRKRLEELNFWGPSCIQSVVWPAVFRNRSFAAIAPPASGKTIAYLLPLLSMLIDGTKYKDLPASHGAVILILGSTWLKVATLRKQCMNLLEGTNKVKVKVLYGGGGDKDHEVSLFNGCDILISTPSSFLRYLQKKATNFDRCCSIILDDGAKLIEHFKDEISCIMKELLVHMKKMRKGTVAPQIGICSEKWTKGVASFAERFLLMPLFFFTSFLEAAVYSEISMYIHSCNSHTIDYVLLGLLDGVILPKVVVCTKDIITAKHVQSVLQTNAMFSMLAHNNMPQYELTAVKRHWNMHHRRDSTFILVVTDSILLSLNIRNADCILHYDLPEISRLSFSQRFGCFGDYFSREHDSNQQKCICHVLITDECKVQAPTLVKLMNRMGLNYPKQLLEFACEQRKLSLNRLEGSLCSYLKAFGMCEDSHCAQRHSVVRESDTPIIVPRQGEVKAVVTEVIDASHYYVKILEYTDPVTSTTVINSAEYTNMFVDLKNHYSQASNKIVAGTVKNGEVYGIEESPNVFYRVRVLQIILTNNGEMQKVKVFFLDDGWVREKETSELLALPEEYQLCPQMCVEAYLSNVKTVDSSNQWTPQANMFVSKLITGKVIHATIALCLGDTMWLDPLVLKEGNSVNVLRLDRTLKRLGLALPNMDHLQILYKACADKIDLPVMSCSAKKSKPQQNVNFAFLDLGESEEVYLPDVISPQEFFIQRCKFYDRLNILEKELSDSYKKGNLKKCRSVQDGMYCIASYPDDGKLYRAQVKGFVDAEETEVDVFFVDYGDTHTSQKSNLYIIPPQFLLLPFQAIQCELAGTSAPQGEWSAEAGDILFDLTRYENGDLKTLTAKALWKTPGSAGKNLYTVQLFDGSLNISEHLVESGLAVATELPELPALPQDKHDKHPDVDWDDIPSGYITACSDDSMDSGDKEAAALFCAALYGLYTPDINGVPYNPKAETSYPPATVEEVTEPASPSERNNVTQQDPDLQESPTTDNINSETSSLNLKSLKPHITWWDNLAEVFITIKLLGVESYDLCPFIDGFSFSTDLGNKHYFVEVTFFAEVIPGHTIVDCQGQCVRISFEKREQKKWPRLTEQIGKVFYIKRDLDHIDTESENEQSDTPEFLKVPRIPVNKEDIRHVCSTDDESSSDDSDYDTSWQRVCLPKEM